MNTVIKQQDEIEVFVAVDNGVVIRQTTMHGQESVVHFWPEHAEVLIAAIERVAIQAEKAAQWVDNAVEPCR